MANIRKEKALSFDDVLLVPKMFDGGTRGSIDISTNVAGLDLDIPIIAANMPSVTEEDMCIRLGNLGGLGILHRMQEKKSMFLMACNVKRNLQSGKKFGGSIGVGKDWEDNSKLLIDAGADVVCIDVAHGHQSSVLEVANAFKERFGDFPLIVGNLSTFSSVNYFSNIIDRGCFNISFKLGVGGGSACSTRIQTGCGVPTLQTVLDCCSAPFVNAIADGGIKNSGDIVKSLAAGAHAVMVGSLLAGTDASPGDPIKSKDGRLYKIYRGNASYGSKKKYFGKAEYIEGVETLVEYKGNLEETVNRLCEGIRSGFSYCGAQNLKDLQKNAEFVEITSSGFKESMPHGLL